MQFTKHDLRQVCVKCMWMLIVLEAIFIHYMIVHTIIANYEIKINFNNDKTVHLKNKCPLWWEKGLYCHFTNDKLLWKTINNYLKSTISKYLQKKYIKTMESTNKNKKKNYIYIYIIFYFIFFVLENVHISSLCPPHLLHPLLYSLSRGFGTKVNAAELAMTEFFCLWFATLFTNILFARPLQG